MALMEDTGWYLPNYSLAEDLKWGKGLGCDFALKSCKEWMDTRSRQRKSIHPYCNKVRCSGQHTRAGLGGYEVPVELLVPKTLLGASNLHSKTIRKIK